MLRYFTAAACSLMIFLMTATVAMACSWDYPIWMIRSKNADPLYRFIRKGKAGYIDRSGRVVVKPEFEFFGNHGGEFHDGLLDIRSFESAGYADTSGKVVITRRYALSEDFSEGLAVVKLDNPERWGYIDRTGEIVLVPRSDAQKNVPYLFSEGLARVSVDKRYGYIDRSGKFVIRPKFLLATDFRDGMARVVTDGPCVYFDDGPCSLSPTRVGEDLQGAVTSCKFMFIDKSGSIVTDGYEAAKDFSEGLAPVSKDDKWGYIDKKGRMVIEPKFDKAEPFSDGMARVKQGDLWGYINRSGELTIGIQFEYADDFSDGLAVVGKLYYGESEDDEFYYIDKRGIQAIPEKFALASHFYKGLAHVKLTSDKKNDDDSDEEVTFAYINITGRKVFTYRYKSED